MATELIQDSKKKLHYVCQRCANCCRWPGEVPVSDEEIRPIATHLGIPESLFIEQYTALRLNRAGLTLIEKPDGACIFLKGNDCAINPVKPAQCGGFPNQWNFEGWRDVCEAIIAPRSPAAAPNPAAVRAGSSAETVSARGSCGR